ncbi:EAL domain-containing protein [Budviciaceae bacterium BWR-B9]|uniref:EAL domain-containing protein n=1 Tax=Limnobaculum allomyrinae TaxID=2791986 RepID=A0ABS1IQE5_9GAMM|nr:MULTISPECIES: biofilm formation regulator HmsP [Limnobaculum]MBK5143975.1 EAL domain-containing protein [Limnobaculum allomyrinae]MBV7691634.1 biofilm formation regulator HmsP [Limnobaculum sp. M2-1]
MQVKRSLTIKQMSLVTVVALATICIFIVIQMFDFIQQRKEVYHIQLDNIGYSVSQPLERALWDRNMKEIQRALDNLMELDFLTKANLIVNAELISVHSQRGPNGKVPHVVEKLLSLPIVSLIPLYSPEYNAIDPQPMGYLVLEADSYKLYQYTLKRLSTLLVAYLLLAFMLSIAISWCLNRLLVYPLRAIADDLRTLPVENIQYHQLTLPRYHQDDELGVLVRSYNRNQQALVQAHHQLTRMSTRDPITDLPNYTLFQELLKQQLLNSGHEKQPFSLLFINLDSFKDIYQALGQEQGNLGLIDAVQRMKEVLGEHTLLARLHGEEFIVLSKSQESPLHAMQLGQRLVENITIPLSINEYQYQPTVSIGIAQYPSDSEEPDGLIAHAQAAMLLAQRRGKNQVLFFEPDMTNNIQQRLIMESEVVRGMKENQFRLYLQPQVDMATGQPYGAEALIRWHYTENDIRYPGDFIPLAEETGLILELGAWVLEEACTTLAHWKQQAIPLTLSVNLSALQLQQPDIIEQLSGLCQQHDFCPSRLILELTETANIYDLKAVLPTLIKMRDLGISIALDDFGTGYCNLNYLSHLPVDELKIDKSFVDGLPDDDELVQIVNSIAQILSLKVVIEGVETQQQVDWLLAHGMHFAQGYLFSRPLPYEMFKEKYLSSYY